MEVERVNIDIDFYHGSYGYTLIVIIKDLEKLLFFSGLINSLYTENNTELFMREYKEFQISGIDDIILKVSNNKKSKIKVVNNIIILEYTKETWETCGCLIDRLIEGSGGHQYFDNYDQGYEEITVEISYKENLI